MLPIKAKSLIPFVFRNLFSENYGASQNHSQWFCPHVLLCTLGALRPYFRIYISKSIGYAWVTLGLLFLAIFSPLSASPQQDFTTWKRLYEEEAAFEEIAAFIETHPDWPSQKTLQKKAEKAISGTHTDQQVIKWFSKFPPLTAEGAFYYAKALLKQGQMQLASTVIKTTWHEKEFTKDFLKVFRTAFQSFLSPADDVKRVNFLLYKEERQAARDMLPFLSSAQQKTTQTRIALCDCQSQNNVATTHGGLAYDRIKYHRRLKNYDEALQLLRSAHPEEAEFAEAWWMERNILARYLIENKQYQQAVQLIKNHRLKMGESYVHAEWMLAWLRLRFLGQAETAYAQFKKIYALVKSPQSQARFAFWAGEAAKKLGHHQDCQTWYKKAANHSGTYYGQLAISQLRLVHKKPLAIFCFAKKPSTSDAVYKNFEKRPLVKVLKSLSQSDKDKYIFFFLFKLADLISSAEEQKLLVQLAQQLGGHHATTEISRELSKKRYVLTETAYPTLAIPYQTHLIGKVAGKRPLFHSLAHAIIRQESRFNPKAESSAGATGIMQLMPATAAEQHKKLKVYGLTVQQGASLFNPEKNIALGAVHLDSLIEEFGGNIILVSAAYNAGSGNVRKWLKAFGDPRETKLSWVDWIEMLPFNETRHYIHRVLENLVAYQHRLPQTKKTTHDLGQILTISLPTVRGQV